MIDFEPFLDAANQNPDFLAANTGTENSLWFRFKGFVNLNVKYNYMWNEWETKTGVLLNNESGTRIQMQVRGEQDVKELLRDGAEKFLLNRLTNQANN